MSALTSDLAAVEQPARQTFPRSRRLKRRLLIQSLFGRTRVDTRFVNQGPIRLLYRRVQAHATGTNSPVQVGFAIGRSIGGAVTKNSVKRVLREEYRRNRIEFEHQHSISNTCLIIMVMLRNPRATPDELTRNLRKALISLESI